VSDRIELVLPAQEDFHHIARLVVGGLAARLELTYEQLEDLETALDAVLRCRDDEGDLSVSLAVDGHTVRTTVGPFGENALAGLDSDDGELGLRRVLETVADRVQVEQRDGGSWIELTKGPPG
jgi:hypothetical protein